MQDSNTNVPRDEGRTRIDVIRHRVQSRFSALSGRGRLALMATTALVGVGLATVAATTAVHSADPSPATVAASADEQARAAAAQRGDRSQRTAPSAAASISAAPKAAKAAPKATKAAPKATKAPAPKPKPRPAPAWVSPMPGAQVTSCFGPRWGTMHEGIDFAKPNGTPIRSIGKGTIIKAGDAGDGYGISVFVDHHNGYLTQYAHMSRAAVGYGQTVKPGQVIGYEGSTGDSTGPHLHFEVHQGMWNQIDPAPWMRAHRVNVGG